MPSSDTPEHVRGIPVWRREYGDQHYVQWSGNPWAKEQHKPYVAHSLSAEACAVRREAVEAIVFNESLDFPEIADAVLAALGLGEVIAP